MINNFLVHEYHPSDVVYTHDQSGHLLHLGDISAALDTDAIKHHAITTVITAAAGMEQVQFDSSVTHIVYPLLDMKSENIARYFSQFYELAQRELLRGNVLVHCAAGISRSSTLVIAYLMRKKMWSFREAIAFVRRARPNVLPNLGFERQLKEYESSLNRQAESGFERRQGSKTSEERKHVSLGMGKGLPDIALMGRTQLRPKILDIFSLENESRSQQRPRGGTSVARQGKDEGLQFYGTKRTSFKPKKSRSIQQRLERPSNLTPLYSDESRQLQRLKGSLPLSQLQEMMVQRMHLNNNKKVATERQIRMKPLHKMAFY